MPSNLDTLIEMGFPRNRAEKALARTNYKGVQEAMEWLFNHSEDPDIDDPFEAPKGNVLSSPLEEVTGGASAAEAEQTDEEAKSAQPASLKCDEHGHRPAVIKKSAACTATVVGGARNVAHTSRKSGGITGDRTTNPSISGSSQCGKRLRTGVDAQAHAARTGHASFSESTEEIKPLTEEEKKEQLEKVKQKIAEKRQQREATEKLEQLEKEKSRRITGKDITTAKFEHEQKEMKLLAEARRREKLEEKAAKAKILAKIQADKDARAAAKAAAKGQPVAPIPDQQSVSTVASPPSEPQTKKEYTECRLQIRLPTGQPITNAFGVSEPLAAVRLYVQMNAGLDSDFTLMTTFPKRVYTDEDMEKPLSSLGLVPSAVIMVTKK